jgi:hypothetical protein
MPFQVEKTLNKTRQASRQTCEVGKYYDTHWIDGEAEPREGEGVAYMPAIDQEWERKAVTLPLPLCVLSREQSPMTLRLFKHWHREGRRKQFCMKAARSFLNV